MHLDMDFGGFLEPCWGGKSIKNLSKKASNKTIEKRRRLFGAWRRLGGVLGRLGASWSSLGRFVRVPGGGSAEASY